MSSREEKLLRLIREGGLIREQESVLIALSGGSDSVSLLFLLCRLREEQPISLYAVHVNHGLRINAEEDELFCRDLCLRMNVPFTARKAEVSELTAREGRSLEEAGRRLRYQILLEEAKRNGADAIAAAHQRDDQAETVLLHLIRGAGLSGLTGMREEIFLDERVRLIRPLLSVPHDELASYLREKEEVWREDESNRDTAFRRNYIRQEIMPRMEKAAPGASVRIAAAGDLLREADDFLQHLASDSWEKAGLAPASDILSASALLLLPPALRRYFWTAWLGEHGGTTDVGFAHYGELNRLVERQDSGSVMLPGGRQVRREQRILRFLDAAPDPEKNGGGRPDFQISLVPCEMEPEGEEKYYTKLLNCDIINGNLTLRHRERGDYFYLPEGKKKSLARYMIDRKIPVGDREKIWLLADGSHILWVVGYRLCAMARVPEKSQMAAKVQIELTEK